MAAEVDSPEQEKLAGGTMLEIPAIDEVVDRTACPQARMPKRLRERLLECKTPSPPTAGDIEAKLKDADLRRQKFYDKLSSRARSKPRSPSHCSSNEEDLGQRLVAKLQAAEQKRLSILAEAQMRLARLDKLRQAAKSGVEMRFEKEREELGTKVESRFVQAEANRMLILNAYGQRRATVKERRSQSLLRRTAWESKYKERVHAAIYQKRAAAETKRLGILEAEKKRACARVLQVRHIAKSVLRQREIERRKLEDNLEDRLQRARSQRAEYLRQRGRLRSSVRVNWNRMHKQADVFSRKIARCWRRFRKLKRTTFALAKAYDALKINEKSVKMMPFEQFALLIESNATLQMVKALVDRFEYRFKLSQALSVTPSSSLYCWNNIDHLLKRVASPIKRSTPRNSTRSRDSKKMGSNRDALKNSAKLSRYQVRIVLCAYMILGHPDAVLSGQGEREIALTKSAGKFVQEFDLLIKIILNGPVQCPDQETNDASPRRLTVRSQLAAFDREWCSYLNCFVAWKVKDAESLEEDLVRAACQLELSMIQTCKMTPEGDAGPLTHDMKAIQKQVTEDQKLLREKVQHLSGEAGIERMDCALSETRTKFFESKERGSPLGSPITGIITPNLPSGGESPGLGGNRNKDSDGQRRVVRSLFQDNVTTSPREKHSDPRRSNLNQFGLSDEQLILENEVIVNEFVHDQHHTLSNIFGKTVEDQDGIKAKIRETMEKAFWDGIIESMKQDEPNFDQIVELVREVRDEICEIAPQSWKQGIIESIDLDIFSQVLKSGHIDMDYLGNILDFSLVTLQKLSSPASDDEHKATRQKLLKELAEICQSENEMNYTPFIAMVKGLRFVLEQIQALKQEISKARIRIMEPLLKGPAGLDYLKTAFSDRYGSPPSAPNSLPLTLQWLSSVWDRTDQEWSEHTNCLASLPDNSSSQAHLPSITLKTGIHLPVKSNGSPSAVTSMTGNQQVECKGEKIDLLLRLGLLNLVSGVSGITHEALPETLKLNFSRLRRVQSQIHQIIVISTSVLICKQIFLSDQLVASTSLMEAIVSKCIKQLTVCLDSGDDVGIKEIVEIINGFLEDSNGMIDTKKLQSRKEVVERMLAKSLQDGDPVFGSVSRAVYLAMRGVVLGGSGTQGKELAEMALRKVGAGGLTMKVVAAAEVLVVVASVSGSLHGPWYAHLMGNRNA